MVGPQGIGRPGEPRGVVHICDDEGHELPTGEVGTVYFELPAADLRVPRRLGEDRPTSHPDHPTWRTLGDIGRLDDDGYLYLTDRKAFMIVSGGVNIYPQEIEDVLLAHPKVLDVAVFGVPNEEMGEEVKAVVQPARLASRRSALTERLRCLVRDAAGRFQAAPVLRLRQQLPRLDNGKLYKAKVRDRYWEGRATRVL